MDLHIVTLDIPFPPAYGGMIDTFYRIWWLHRAGVKIHLHCFGEQGLDDAMLARVCCTVRYYPRHTSVMEQLSSRPYIVEGRKDERLLENLLDNDYPILFDGLHTTYYLGHPGLSGRKKLVRMHNIEHEYYSGLAGNEINYFRKAYFTVESSKLGRYEKILSKADHILAVSRSDQDHFSRRYGNSVFLPPFHPFSRVLSKPGTGEYLVYHADLSVNENIRMAEMLIADVFSYVPYHCILAGKNPPASLSSKAAKHPNIELVANPGRKQMKMLITNAHVNLVPALHSNGFKIKILYALFQGRHCLANGVAARSSMVPDLCVVEDSGKGMVRRIRELMEIPFTEGMIASRDKVLHENFDNMKNAEAITLLLK